MADRPGVLADTQKSTSTKPNVFLEAAEEIPTALGDFGRGIKDHPLQLTEHVALEVAVSVAASIALSYLMPARGPFGLILGAAMMVPTLVSAGKSLYKAHTLAEQPGADTKAIGHQLADQTVAGSLDLGLNFLGGWAGAGAAYKLADSDTAAGALSRNIRSWVLDKENNTLGFIKGFSQSLGSMLSSASDAPVVAAATDVTGSGLAGPLSAASTTAGTDLAGTRTSGMTADWQASNNTLAALAGRAQQVDASTTTAPGSTRTFRLASVIPMRQQLEKLFKSIPTRHILNA